MEPVSAIFQGAGDIFRSISDLIISNNQRKMQDDVILAEYIRYETSQNQSNTLTQMGIVALLAVVLIVIILRSR